MTSQEKNIALREIFNSEYPRFRSYTRSLQRNLTDLDAEDIIQDVALNLFSRVDFDTPVENLLAYVYRSIKNRIIDIQRRRKSIKTIRDEGRNSYSVEKENAGEEVDHELREKMLEAMFTLMDDLGAGHAEILWATEFEGRSFRELSLDWGIPIGTLLARKHRAIASLQQLFRKKYPELWKEYFQD